MQKAASSFAMFVSLSACNNSVPACRVLAVFYVGEFLPNPYWFLRKFMFAENFTKIIHTLHEKLSKFMILCDGVIFWKGGGVR